MPAGSCASIRRSSRRSHPPARRPHGDGWDMIREPSVEEYKKLTMVRIEALNHALRGLPPERVRYHLCWGSWLGRMYRHPMRDTSM